MIKKVFTTLTLSVALLLTGAFSTNVSAAACPNDQAVLGFPTWFHGLDCKTTTNPNGTETSSVDLGGNPNKIWVIAMNILQWLMIAGGYVALYFIIWGGFQFITAQGEPDKIKSAKNAITNAVIGLIIVLAAVAIVRTIQGSISGSIV